MRSRLTTTTLAKAALTAAALLLSGCGGSHSSGWTDLKTVSVTVARPGLPPPGGIPKTTVFSSKAELAVATTALNKFHIAQRSASQNNGCAGGETVQIAVTKGNGDRVQMSGYDCAGRTSGDIGGDLPGFLDAVGAGPNT